MKGYILVIEDDEPIRNSVIEVLEDAEYQVASACDGAAGLALLRDGRERPRLILLDWMMPVMDGPSFVAEVREDEALRDLPVVVMSAVRGKSEALSRSNLRILEKPVRIEDLLALAAEHCDDRP